MPKSQLYSKGKFRKADWQATFFSSDRVVDNTTGELTHYIRNPSWLSARSFLPLVGDPVGDPGLNPVALPSSPAHSDAPDYGGECSREVYGSTNDEWLIHQFSRNGVTLLYVSVDAREAHVLVPTFDLLSASVCKKAARTHLTNCGPFSFVGIRDVQFSGGKVLVSWCTNPGCGTRALNVNGRSVYEGTDFKSSPSSAFFDDTPPLCPCGVAAIHVLSGSTAFPEWLKGHVAEPEDPDEISDELPCEEDEGMLSLAPNACPQRLPLTLALT
jgi:hypothetical protein